MVLHDVETGAEFVPLQELADARLEVFNSPLTETAVIDNEIGPFFSRKSECVRQGIPVLIESFTLPGEHRRPCLALAAGRKALAQECP